MKITLKKMRNYEFPRTKELPHEDVTPNIVAEGEAANKPPKLDDVLRMEREMKRAYPQFMVFYMDIPYPQRIRKMVTDMLRLWLKCLKDQSERKIGYAQIVLNLI